MSLVKDMIQQLVNEGKVSNSFTVRGIRFEMENLTTEEQLLADGLVDISKIAEKYQADKDISVLPDMIQKYRTIAQVTFAIKKVNGQSPVDEQAAPSEQFKQRLEFKDELIQLGTAMLDELIDNYRSLVAKQKDFLDDVEENVKK
jgi:hypothetical protein